LTRRFCNGLRRLSEKYQIGYLLLGKVERGIDVDISSEENIWRHSSKREDGGPAWRSNCMLSWAKSSLHCGYRFLSASKRCQSFRHVFGAFQWPCPYKPQLREFTGLRAWVEWIYSLLLRVEDRALRYKFQQNQLMPHPISRLFQRVDLNIFALRIKTDYIHFRGIEHGSRTCVFVYIHIIQYTQSDCWLPLLPASCWFLASLILLPWGWRRNIPPKYKLNFSGLYSALHRFNLYTVVVLGAGMAQSVQRLATSWTTEWSEFESR
jgi:hypothetical protein